MENTFPSLPLWLYRILQYSLPNHIFSRFQATLFSCYAYRNLYVLQIILATLLSTVSNIHFSLFKTWGALRFFIRYLVEDHQESEPVYASLMSDIHTHCQAAPTALPMYLCKAFPAPKAVLAYFQDILSLIYNLAVPPWLKCSSIFQDYKYSWQVRFLTYKGICTHYIYPEPCHLRQRQCTQLLSKHLHKVCVNFDSHIKPSSIFSKDLSTLIECLEILISKWGQRKRTLASCAFAGSGTCAFQEQILNWEFWRHSPLHKDPLA